jgi:predicted RNA-binding protein with PUA-like domain
MYGCGFGVVSPASFGALSLLLLLRTDNEMRHWLMKTEPGTFGIDDLMARPRQTEPWYGVRNYTARNFMRDSMKKGDQVFIYHSSCPETGIVGIARVVKEAYPDSSQFDVKSEWFDPKSDPANPRWHMVDVKFVRRLRRVILLQSLREHAAALDDFALLRRGNRLSILPVTAQQWNTILALE